MNFETLLAVAEARRGDYALAQPFPHAVLDGLLSEALLDPVLAEFPGPQAIDWRHFRDGTGRKRATRDEGQLGPRTLALLHQLNSSRFLRFLERLTGIEGLIPDPHFEGGGLHEIDRGGFLKVHADFNRHPSLALDRRLNLLIYLNRDWREEYGGHLELWGADMKRCARRVLPIFNRCVVFTTTDVAFHGHPEPLACPEGRSRRSIALYYYTNGRPAREVSRAHSTLYQRRPGEAIYAPVASLRTLVHRLLGRDPAARSARRSLIDE